MKYIITIIIGLFLLPLVSSAHEDSVYEINGVQYEIVVGSLGEPVIVDDKTGVDMEIVRAGRSFVGAEQDLQLEISAAGVKKILPLEPVYNAPGRYKAVYFPTVATTMSYRIFGTLENTPFDVTYTCNPVGHPQTDEDRSRVDISPGVARTLLNGAFGCPQEKDGFGFPESSSDLYTLRGNIGQIEAVAGEAATNAGTARMIGIVGAIFGILGLIVAAFAFAGRKKHITPTSDA